MAVGAPAQAGRLRVLLTEAQPPRLRVGVQGAVTFSPGRSPRRPAAGLRPQRVSPAKRAGHGFSSAELAWVLRRQGHRCLGCGGQGSEALGPDGTPWQVDHDHALAARHPHPVSQGCKACFRGVLCAPCNRVLAFARDDADVLDRLARYLRSPRVPSL